VDSASIGMVFDAAHAGFAVWSSLLWEPIGAATVAEIRTAQGQRVLDACCGNGAAAVPAAAAVGPTGWVDGVDLAPKLLAAGRRRASEAGLRCCPAYPTRPSPTSSSTSPCVLRGGRSPHQVPSSSLTISSASSGLRTARSSRAARSISAKSALGGAADVPALLGRFRGGPEWP